MSSAENLFGPDASLRFESASRVQQSLFAILEKRCLVWLARRTPEWLTPDQLTLLGFAAMFLAGISYVMARWWALSLLLVNACLALNWFGDSLDGTLARARNRQRPRYGFFVDHMVDSFGALFLTAGLALSAFASERVAFWLLLLFLLLSINSYLATYTRGTFHLSFWKFSPTEIRILLAVGNTVALWKPRVLVFGHLVRFMDVSGVIAIAAMTVVLLVSVTQNTRALYNEERL